MNRRSFLVTSFASAAATAGGQSKPETRWSIGDERLRIALESARAGLKETAYFVGDEPIAGLHGVDPWRLELDDGPLTPGRPQEFTESPTTVKAIGFEGASRGYRWRMEYRVSGPGLITKSLHIRPERDVRLREAALWSAECDAAPLVGRSRIQEFVAFYRDRGRGIFVSLDYPYSRISVNGPHASVTYRPHEILAGGAWYECHSLTIGATRFVESGPAGFHPGEVDAFDAYVQNHQPLRFERPMDVYASIVNRYTQVHGSTVFYTMKNQPTLAFNTDLVERDLELMSKLGMEYYQVFPGAFEWAPNDPRSEVDRMVRSAHRRGLRIGDYSAATRVYSPHFNIGNNRLNRPDWQVRDTRGDLVRDTYCFGHVEFERFYTDTVVANCRRYGFEMHCLDMFKLVPCFASDHGHPTGEDSLYHQVRGLLRMISAVNSVAPQMMTWPNSGDWLEILPKLAWYTPNLYLTDPFIEAPWQGLNMTRLLDDSRREQMVSLHHESLLPYRFFTNCQYFFSQNSIVPDIRNFEYGALSTLAVTPNLCLGEFRPWVDNLPPSAQERVFGFYQRWTQLVATHYPLWKRVFEGGERPGFGAVEVYSHAEGNHGFVFLVNPNYWDRRHEIALDRSLGFSGDGRCEIAELYPAERLWLTAQGPWPQFGTNLPVTVPAQSVLVLEVRPAPEDLQAPRLYGVPGAVETRDDVGYRVKTWGPQGHTAHFAVLLPKGSKAIRTGTVLDYGNEPDPRLAAPTPLKMLTSKNEGALFEVIFRRDPAPCHLCEWKFRPGTLDHGVASRWNTGIPESEAVPFPLFVVTGIEMPLTPDRAESLGLGAGCQFLWGVCRERIYGRSRDLD